MESAQRANLGKWLVVGGSALIGVGLLATSWQVHADYASRSWSLWAESVLVNLGAAFLLVAPIELISARLSQRVEQAATETNVAVGRVREDVRVAGEETARSVEAIRQDVEEVRAEVASLGEFGARVEARLEAERNADTAAYAALGDQEPSREVVLDALRRARGAGILSQHVGLRAEAHHGLGDYVALMFFEGEYGDNDVSLILQTPSGERTAEVFWSQGRTAEDVMVEVARHLGRPGEFVAGWWKTISETLLVGASHAARRRIIELVPPQWAVLDEGIVPYPDHPLGGLGRLDLYRGQAIIAARDVAWVHAESLDGAAATWLTLFPATPWEL